jgi:hypothetical protein
LLHVPPQPAELTLHAAAGVSGMTGFGACAGCGSGRFTSRRFSAGRLVRECAPGGGVPGTTVRGGWPGSCFSAPGWFNGCSCRVGGRTGAGPPLLTGSLPGLDITGPRAGWVSGSVFFCLAGGRGPGMAREPDMVLTAASCRTLKFRADTASTLCHPLRIWLPAGGAPSRYIHRPLAKPPKPAPIACEESRTSHVDPTALPDYFPPVTRNG